MQCHRAGCFSIGRAAFKLPSGRPGLLPTHEYPSGCLLFTVPVSRHPSPVTVGCCFVIGQAASSWPSGRLIQVASSWPSGRLLRHRPGLAASPSARLLRHPSLSRAGCFAIGGPGPARAASLSSRWFQFAVGCGTRAAGWGVVKG